jgi:hypothetical protein
MWVTPGSLDHSRLDGSSAVTLSGMNAGDGVIAVVATDLLVVYR